MTNELEKPKAVLLKILGVCCPFEFAKTKLINYSIENCEQFLDKHLLDENILKIIPKLKKFYHHIIADNQNCPTVSFDKFLAISEVEDEAQRKKLLNEKTAIVNEFKNKLNQFLIWAFQFANSSSPVNEIQNFIWELGYLENKLKSEFYDDVVSKLKEWKEQGIRIFTFSSGTIHGQQVTFKNSSSGNLIGFLDGQISTNLINLDKRDLYCYKKVAEIIGESKKAILFITPSIHEAKAAFLSGYRVCLLRRDKKSEDEEEDSNCKTVFNLKRSLKELTFV